MSQSERPTDGDGPYSGERPPNVVHVILDDIGIADLGCYGGSAIETPNLDRMADDGMRSTQAYTGAPVCAPSRSVLMTGQHTGNTSVRGNSGGIPVESSVRILPEVLSDAGYATGGFGKWGIGDIDTEGAPERKGFDTFFGYYHQIHAHSYYPDYLVENSEKVDQTGGRDEGGAYSHYEIVDRMMTFVDDHAGGDDPFYCYAPWTPPHGPMDIPEDDPAWERYADEDWPEDHRVAAAMISMVDRQVGELIDRLEEHGVAEETLVLFSSDHGAASRREGTLDSCGAFRGSKRTVYEGGIRTPFIAYWPGTIEAGRVNSHPWYYPDLFPTIAELAGVSEEVPDDVDGHSLCPTLLGYDACGRDQPEHEYMYWSLPKMNWSENRYAENGLEQAVRAGDWKLLRNDEDEPWELYNLTTDPVEENDVADDRPEIVARLKEYVREAEADRPPRPEPEMPDGSPFR